MRLKHLLFLLLALLGSTTLRAYDACVNNIYYNFKEIYGNGYAHVTYGDYHGGSYTGSVVIPESVTYEGTTYSVTSIGYQAFYYCSGLTSVTIPSSVTSIDDEAFNTCRGLKSVTIPNSVTQIGQYAFYSCSSLIGITIPSSVTLIGREAFNGCSSLNSIIVESGNTIFDSRNNCNAIIQTETNTLITGCKNTIIPESVTDIISYAFLKCNGLTSITIPKNIMYIGRGAFEGCADLTSIIVSNENRFYDSRNNCNAIIETATNTLIAGCMNTIIPESVTSIGDEAFYGCTGLTSITIPESVTSIGYEAFYDCTGLTGLVIPESVTSIGYLALSGTAWNADVSEGVVYAGKVAYGYTGTKPSGTLTLKEGTLGIAQRAFQYCSNLTSVIIPNSVKKIGMSAFSDCSNLSSVSIGNNVTEVGQNAFSGTAWYNNQPDGLVYVGSVAYEYKGYLPENTDEIVLEDGTLGITAWAFSNSGYRLSGLKSIVFPNSLTNIGEFAFNNSNLTSITIPEGVTYIYAGAFYGCRNLTSVVSLIKKPFTLRYVDNTFWGISSNCVLTVPYGTRDAYIAAGWTEEVFKGGIVEAAIGVEYVTNLLSNKWSGAEYSVQAATFDSGVNYGDWNDSNPNYNQIVGVPEADANGRNWYEVEYTCNWQEMTAPLNNWCQDGNFGDIYARRTFYYDEEMPEELFLACGHDDAPCEYYLNGELIWSVTDGWFDQEIYKLTSAQKALLRPGELNVLAFHVHQNYGGMYADCGLYTSLSEMGISNKCGDNLTWSFDYETGTLTISGTGDMYDFSYYSEDIPNTPWVGIRNLIKHIDVQDGATRIGSDAFLECSALTSVTLPNSVTSIGGSAFLGCSSLTDVYCYTENVPTTENNAFNNSPIATATLHVPAASLEAYRTTAPWSAFGTIVPIDGFVINDETTSLDVVTEESGKAVIFTHDFNGEWEALYLPFAINYDDIKADFDLAEIDGVVQNDQNNDGIADITVLSIIGFKGQHTTPNKPYLIRAKNAGNQTINFEDVTVYPTEELTFDCASFSTKYDFTGSYYTLNASALANRYVVQGGELVKGASSLAPCRWYMTATARNGAPLNLPNRIRIMPVEDVITGVEDLNTNVKLRDSLFDLQGRKVTNPQKGIYIQNGKKVALK